MYNILSKQHYAGWLLIIVLSLLITGCSSGGSSSGTGTSTVQGNVVSFSMAFAQPKMPAFSLLAILKQLKLMPSAYAATTVENIQVAMSRMTTMTDANGNFSFEGVPTGTHEIRFNKDGQTARMFLEVRGNDHVTMTRIRINGHQAHADSVSHTNRDSMTPGSGDGTPMH